MVPFFGNVRSCCSGMTCVCHCNCIIVTCTGVFIQVGLADTLPNLCCCIISVCPSFSLYSFSSFISAYIGNKTCTKCGRGISYPPFDFLLVTTYDAMNSPSLLVPSHSIVDPLIISSSFSFVHPVILITGTSSPFTPGTIVNDKFPISHLTSPISAFHK